MKRIISLLAALLLLAGMPAAVFASTFVDAHGNEIELDDTLEAYTEYDLLGADDAARKGETNLGDFWADALRWFATSGKINDYFEEDDVALGNTSIAVDADHIVAIWNGGNLRDDLKTGKFGAEDLAKVLPYPNKVAVVYLTGDKLLEALEASSYGQPYTKATAASAASLLQVSGMKYTVDANKMYAKGEAYGKNWFKATAVNQVSIQEVNGKVFDKDATYAVITSNAYFNGMDSAYVLKEASSADNRCAITTAVVRDVVWMYISEELGNRIGESYAKPQGRLTILAPAFADVEGGSYYAQPVAWAVEKGITGGTSADTFSPGASCTRAQAMTFLWVAAGKPEPKKGDAAFSDVPSGAYYEKAVLWADEQGITSGTGEGKFSPDMEITRAQAVTFLWAALGKPKAESAAFTDIPEGAYYADAASWALAKGVTGGVGEGLFGPERLCTRAQIVTFLYNAYK
ncbi:MAG: S-layer homology domain-containing protein [Clostridia bacterium]|nr:S-layer homology domain-containing protein [Clostridia bacterium]